MKEVIEVLKKMGAKNVEYDESQHGEYSDTLSFEYKGEAVHLIGCWMNTQEGGIDGSVSKIIKKGDLK